ncbi:MAG: 1-(5-phosphoribosyl)-5-[(5-phosphoribosylamino)methylideneamino]imidazole-4-carboxamide isomerase [Halarsenatibacteraceae bacterium]
MIVIPAIDIIDGKAVRLTKGDYDREEVMDQDPAARARSFQEDGASAIHLVDLDGAKAGKPVNQDLIEEICSITGMASQIGGGIRNYEFAAAYLKVADAVVIGTAAIKNPELPVKLAGEYGSDRVIVGLDAREGRIALSGWEEDTEIKVEEVIEDFISKGIKRFIYTDIDKDGMLEGPNFEYIERLLDYGVEITASGGITTLDDLKKLESIGVKRAIVGKAIYKGLIDVKKIWQEGI